MAANLRTISVSENVSEGASAGARRGSRISHVAIVAGAGLAIRVWLIFVFPIIFGNDTMMRLINRDKILMSYQLPLLQVCIYLLSKVSTDPLLIRLFVAVVGAAAGVGFYLLAADFVDRRAALWAALLFTTNPLIASISTVPYQEIFMLTGLFFAFHFAFGERWLAAGLCLGLACLTRFEAWVACPVLMFYYAQRAQFKFARLLKAGILFGWAPLAWLAFRGGLSPAGSYVIDHSISFWRLQRLVYLGWITVKNTPILALLLAFAGAASMFAQGAFRNPRVRVFSAFLLVFLAAILFSAHGESPNPERYVTMREAHIPIAAVVLLAAFALQRYGRAAVAIGALSVLLGAYGSFRFVERETSKPEVRLGYEVARYLDRNVRPGESALVMAKPIPPSDVQMYFSKVRQIGGEAALRAAEKIVAGMDTSPLDYQRTRIHSDLAKEQLRPFPELPSNIKWIAVWSDFTAPDARSAEWARLAFSHPAAVLKWGPRSVALYHSNSVNTHTSGKLDSLQHRGCCETQAPQVR